jgi:general secretion pathway protein H
LIFTRGRRALGFTLIELLVAFAIMGFAMALVPMAYSKLNQAIEYRASIRSFITQVSDARLKAMTTGRSAAIRVNLTNKTYGIDGQLNQSWPASYEVRAIVDSQEVEAGKIASIRFYPDGSSTGGSISILRAPGVGVRFRIDWLTGRMTQESLDAE